MGAPRRRTRAELRALLLDAGVEVLLEEGLGTGAEHLTFKRVFDRVAATSGFRVTNASVIGRIWDNQAEFQSAVLTSVAAEEVTDQELSVREATADLVIAADRLTMEGRRAAMREVIRATAEANIGTADSSRSWATVIGVWAMTSGSRGRPSDVIHDAIKRSYDAITERNRVTTDLLTSFLGLRLRPPFEVDQFTVACMALVEGCTLRGRVVDDGGIDLPTGPDGAMQTWTLLGIAMEALVDQFYVFDPEWSPDSIT